MKAWPIIFSAPMVKALLAGRKKQTRRIPTSQWANVARRHADGEECWLWVRERWWHDADGGDVANEYGYLAEGRYPAHGENWGHVRHRPSIHMPRWASRFSLKVEAIGLERLQDISEEDAEAEGVRGNASGPWGREGLIEDFMSMWDSLHTKPGATSDDNPEVYAIRFAVHCSNIDMIGERPNG